MSSSTPLYNNLNYKIGKAIVAYREANGPFHTLFDLNKVVVNGTAFQGMYKVANTPFTVNYFSSTMPYFQDYVDQYATLMNASNLLTTHSDTFTCYIDLQGWSNVGGTNPQKVIGAARPTSSIAAAWFRSPTSPTRLPSRC